MDPERFDNEKKRYEYNFDEDKEYPVEDHSHNNFKFQNQWGKDVINKFVSTFILPSDKPYPYSPSVYLQDIFDLFYNWVYKEIKCDYTFITLDALASLVKTFDYNTSPCLFQSADTIRVYDILFNKKNVAEFYSKYPKLNRIKYECCSRESN